MIESYGKVLRLGSKYLRWDPDKPVIIEEKVDGSQFSFGIFDGVLQCRSKGAEIDLDNPQALFAPAVASVKAMTCIAPGFVYRGEALCKPRHNNLAYDRTPRGNIALFDVMASDGSMSTHEQKHSATQYLGIECVPRLYEGPMPDLATLTAMVNDTDSFLGGQKIEGIVIKQGATKAKLVSEKYKETTTGRIRAGSIGSAYCSEPRFRKAMQHLRDDGKLKGEPSDIGLLFREFQRDLLEECGDELKEQVWAKHKKAVLRDASAGLAEWYLKELET